MKAQIGSVSEATMLTRDLLPAFADELERIADTGMHDELIKEARDVDPESDDADEIVNELADALSNYAPPFCYFGSHPGDGSDYGFWFDDESLQEAMRDGIKIGDRTVTQDGYMVEVNDHGNVTVWTIAAGEEVVSIT
jgi:hypothetical protein